MTKLLRLEAYARFDHCEMTSRVRAAIGEGGGSVGDLRVLPDRSAYVEFEVSSDDIERFQRSLLEAELQLSQGSEELLGHICELRQRAPAARIVPIPGTLQVSCRPDHDVLTVDTPPAPEWWWDWDW